MSRQQFTLYLHEHPEYEQLASRFWSRVDQGGEGCWLWTWGLHRLGYGAFQVGSSESWLAHRFAYLLSYRVLPGGKSICHRCDTRACCRPDHLFAATQAENIQDAWQKGRGVTPHKGKLITPAQKDEIRRLYAAGAPQAQIAAALGISQSSVSRALSG